MLKRKAKSHKKLKTSQAETIFYKMRCSLSLLFSVAVISISPVINDILQDSTVTSKYRFKKSEIKRSKCRISYYANSVASYN